MGKPCFKLNKCIFVICLKSGEVHLVYTGYLERREDEP